MRIFLWTAIAVMTLISIVYLSSVKAYFLFCFCFFIVFHLYKMKIENELAAADSIAKMSRSEKEKIKNAILSIYDKHRLNALLQKSICATSAEHWITQTACWHLFEINGFKKPEVQMIRLFDTTSVASNKHLFYENYTATQALQMPHIAPTLFNKELDTYQYWANKNESEILKYALDKSVFKSNVVRVWAHRFEIYKIAKQKKITINDIENIRNSLLYIYNNANL